MTRAADHDDRQPSDAGVADDTISLSPSERAVRDSSRRRRGGDTPSAPTTASRNLADTNPLPLGDPDRYDYAGEQGRGGLGRVIRAHDRSLGRTVAIKELATVAGESRFVREARLTARLQHPGIVPVHEAGRWPGGEPYYVMKLISGRTLKEMVRARTTLSERLGLLREVVAVAEAIAYAHSEGVIHRDLKPANVVVGEFGEAVVVDWGLAKDLRATEAEEPVASVGGADDTVAGDVLGTPAYMPPEQARGEEVTERADVYALGALLYEVLAGQPPYAGEDSHEVIAKVLAGPPPALEKLQPGVPLDLLAIVNKATEREPAARYPSAKELADDLARFQTGQLVTAHRYSRRTLVKRWLWRHRGAVSFAVIGLVLAAVIGAVSLQRVVDQRNIAQRERARAEHRRNQLILQQARTSLVTDPTATIAWLKALPAAAASVREIAAMVDQATASGVARHVLRSNDWFYQVLFSPDSRTLVVASRDEKLRVWDVATGTARSLGAQPGGTASLALSPDGKQLATGGVLGKLWLWQVATGEHRELAGFDSPVLGIRFATRDRVLVRTEDGRGLALSLPGAEVVVEVAGRAIAASADGATIAVATASGDIEWFDGNGAAVGRLGPEVRNRLGKVANLGLSPDGRTLVTHGEDESVRLVTLATGEIRTIGHHAGKVAGIEFSAAGDRLVIAGDNGLAEVWDLELGASQVLRGHEDAIYMATFSADGRQVATAGDDGTARLWNLTTGDVHVLRGHDDDVVAVALSPDGRYLASASLDGSARLWSTHFDSGRVLVGDQARVLRRAGVGRSPAGAIGHVVLSDDGRTVISHSHDGEIRVWDVASGSNRLLGHTSLPDDLLPMRPPVSRDGGLVAAPELDGSISLWQVATGAQRQLRHHRDKVTALGFTADGSSLMSAGGDGDVVLWNLTDFSSRVVVSGAPVRAAALSDSGRLAVATTKSIRVWDAATGTLVTELDTATDDAGHNKLFQVLVLSPDGEWLVVPGWKGQVVLWNVASGEARLLPIGRAGLTDLAFSPDNRFLAAASGDRSIHLWELDSGVYRILAGHQDLVMDLTFSRDSSLLASASYDKTIRLWPLDGGPSRVIRGHAASVDAVAIAADGSFLVSGGRDATVRVWRLDDLPTLTAATLAERLDTISSAMIGLDDQLSSNRGQ